MTAPERCALARLTAASPYDDRPAAAVDTGRAVARATRSADGRLGHVLDDGRRVGAPPRSRAEPSGRPARSPVTAPVS
ncbi:hypothetical protein ACIF8T_31495 [Streptomyces sp. NPDC085946]|uniref:hypothetical protein n=1 Tax=Streptomyces sp. NPDC085946 TaxID=3365744 RepID=UPI0037CEB666